jgi:hypothetical protein|tara:strand:+ start:3861 stop:4448 length:588 start_codon:yes stop_codon:yes gene_type:complete
MNKLNQETEEWVWNTWDQHEPQWFVSILWNDLPSDAVTTSAHAKTLRTLLLAHTSGVGRAEEIPEFPKRLGITTFHERTEMGGRKIRFHTHMHIYNSEGIWSNEADAFYCIRHTVGRNVRRLLKTDTPENRGVVVRPWQSERHNSYNFKEMRRHHLANRTRWIQDRDLLLDPINSDLLPMQKMNHGHERLSTRSY